MPVFLLFACGMALGAPSLSAQWPGEIRGRVTDALSGAPVSAAWVELRPGGLGRETGGDGSFRFRGLEPGDYTLTVSALGYAARDVDAVVANGSVALPDVPLQPVPRVVRGVDAVVSASPSSLDREAIRRVSATSAGDVVASLPGVLVTRTSGGAQSPSIRGSTSDAVLVLVDGVPLNDPITGEADLSRVAASTLERVTVLPGARSARYGEGAAAGVILIDTGPPERSAEARLAAGSLGERTLDGALLGRVPGGTIDLRVDRLERDGAFDFERPVEVGGGAARLVNADAVRTAGRVAWTRERPSGTIRLGATADRLERGLPGRSFAPSPHARQETAQVRAFASASRTSSTSGRSALRGWLHRHRSRYRDDAPPFGAPYDDVTTMWSGGAEAELAGRVGAATTYSAGLSGSHLRVRSDALSEDRALVSQTDVGAWVSLERRFGTAVAAHASLRGDRGGVEADWFLSHDVGAVARAGSVTLRASHRSSFSAPTLGDRFFREGVGVEPNPDLDAERVGGEWVVGLGWGTTLGPAHVSLEADAYRADVQGMIIWLPDYRFVWSPRNRDVHRRGVETSLAAGLPGGLEIFGDLAWNRATYARAGDPDVQVVYRPRVSARVGASLSRPSLRISLIARRTGARLPVPNDVNELPAFWATDATVERSWTLGAIELGLRVAAERVFDHEDSLIFAFPHPGRTLRFSIHVAPNRD